MFRSLTTPLQISTLTSGEKSEPGCNEVYVVYIKLAAKCIKRNKHHSSNLHAQFNAMGAFASFRLMEDVSIPIQNYTTCLRYLCNYFTDPEGTAVTSLGTTGLLQRSLKMVDYRKTTTGKL